ncbi:MAG: DNA polymerase III subunit beta, partial [Bacteroidales bacterium]|nr:DNA polymerase III subunit beta [Bacteroidales bacterium]
KPGSTTIPAKLLLSAVQKFDGSTVTIDTNEDEKSVVTCGTAVFRFAGLPAKDFPKMTSEVPETSIVVEKKHVRDMLRKTIHAVSLDKGRGALAGVLFSFKDEKAMMISADGYRMSLYEISMEGLEKPNERDFVLPRETAQIVLGAISGEGSVKVEGYKSQIAFSFEDGTKIFSKLIDSTYPNVRQVVPDINDGSYSSVKVDRESFIRAIDRVSVFSGDDASAIKVNFAPNELVLSCASSSSSSEARDSVPVKYEGESFDILFTPKNISEPLRVIDDDEITISTNGSFKPVVLTCGVPFTEVVMPRRQ